MSPTRKPIMNTSASCLSILLGTLGFALAAPMAMAQSDNGAAETQETQVPEMLDAERAFQIAKAAAEAGELQAAIVALERVLLVSPGLANIQFELGLLYKRVGALTRARYFLQESMKDPAMPPAIRERAELELASLSSDESPARGDFYGLLGVQIQQDSNARSVSDTQQVNDEGTVVFSENTLRNGEDFSGQVSLMGGYRYRFGVQGATVWNTRVNLGIHRYNEFFEEDNNSFSLRSELTVPVGGDDSARKVTYTPYVQASAVDEINDDDDEDFSNKVAAGIGLTLRSEGAGDAAEVDLNYVVQGEEDTAGVSTSLYFGTVSKLLHSLGFALRRYKDGEYEPDSFHGVTLRYSMARQLGTRALRLPVIGRVGVQGATRFHDAVDLQLSPDTVRRDDQVSVFSSLDIPLTASVTANLGARYVDTRSTIESYQFDNTQVYGGVNWRF